MSDQLIRWCCVDRLSRQRLPGLEATGISHTPTRSWFPLPNPRRGDLVSCGRHKVKTQLIVNSCESRPRRDCAARLIRHRRVLRYPLWFFPHPTGATSFVVWSMSQTYTQVSGPPKSVKFLTTSLNDRLSWRLGTEHWPALVLIRFLPRSLPLPVSRYRIGNCPISSTSLPSCTSQS